MPTFSPRAFSPEVSFQQESLDLQSYRHSVLTHAVLAQSIDLLALLPGSSVVDLGCGVSSDAAELVEAVQPGGRVVLLDSDTMLLTRAWSTTPCNRGVAVDLRISDAMHTGLPDASFDAVRAIGLLSEVSDVSATLREMVRITAPGGRICAVEIDWGSMRLLPEGGVVEEKIRESLGNASVARGLQAQFLREGLTEVREDVSTLRFSSREELERKLSLNDLFSALFNQEKISIGEYGQWSARLSDAEASGGFSGQINVLLISASAPR